MGMSCTAESRHVRVPKGTVIVKSRTVQSEVTVKDDERVPVQLPCLGKHVGSGVDVEVAVDVGVDVEVAVGVGVDVEVEVGVGVEVEVEVAVGVAVAVDVAEADRFLEMKGK